MDRAKLCWLGFFGFFSIAALTKHGRNVFNQLYMAYLVDKCDQVCTSCQNSLIACRVILLLHLSALLTCIQRFYFLMQSFLRQVCMCFSSRLSVTIKTSSDVVVYIFFSMCICIHLRFKLAIMGTHLCCL